MPRCLNRWLYKEPGVSSDTMSISVVMPCLNQARTIADSVRSLIDGQGVDVELLVMDGGSTDGTQAWVRPFFQRTH